MEHLCAPAFLYWLVLVVQHYLWHWFIFLEPYVQATFAELYAALRAKALANGYTNEYELGGFVRH